MPSSPRFPRVRRPARLRPRSARTSSQPEGSGPPRPARSRRWRPAALPVAFLCAAVVWAVTMLPATSASSATSGASAASAAAPQADVVGNATHFDGLGQPYGGCGVPQAELETQDFVALNVFNTPGDYTMYPRPVPAGQAARIGAWNNGHNCGRWVKVTVSDFCTGTNDGAANQPFCRNGSWVADSYNGATLTMLVADSCADTNAWCRDDPNHLDLVTSSLGRFTSNGAVVTGLADHWNNRHVSWSYVPAPSYTGDIKIGFIQGAQRYWPAISVAHLPNGVHGVQYLADGTWHDAQMNGDMGQSFILAPTTSAGTDYSIRVSDVADSYVFGGRVYDFSLPASCGSTCSSAFTAVTYRTEGGTGTPTTTPPTTPTTTPPTTPTTTPPTTATGAACTAALTVTGKWQGGFQADVKVANSGTSKAISGWSVKLATPSGVTLGSVWNAVLDSGGPPLVVHNAAYNGSLAPAASTTYGMTMNGDPTGLAQPVCTPL